MELTAEKIDGKKADAETSQVLEKDVMIEVNYPAQVKDPGDGRMYRFFQTGYHGPIRPGDPEFEQVVGGEAEARNALFLIFYGYLRSGPILEVRGLFHDRLWNRYHVLHESLLFLKVFTLNKKVHLVAIL